MHINKQSQIKSNSQNNNINVDSLATEYSYNLRQRVPLINSLPPFTTSPRVNATEGLSYKPSEKASNENSNNSKFKQKAATYIPMSNYAKGNLNSDLHLIILDETSNTEEKTPVQSENLRNEYETIVREIITNKLNEARFPMDKISNEIESRTSTVLTAKFEPDVFKSKIEQKKIESLKTLVNKASNEYDEPSMQLEEDENELEG